mmetsp:Transcript_3376/g.5720  ORF Transcript_3376/g.5720 Transcript_3376/m.5720 type:complete len:84 (-) Transcript_3376:1962-2213(-)
MMICGTSGEVPGRNLCKKKIILSEHCTKFERQQNARVRSINLTHIKCIAASRRKSAALFLVRYHFFVCEGRELKLPFNKFLVP